MRILMLLLCAGALFIGCDDGGDGTASAPMPLEIGAQDGSHLMLFWQAVIFEDPGAFQSTLSDRAPGTLLPIVDGVVDLNVTPNYALYDGACAHFGPEICDDAMRDIEATRAYSAATLIVVDDLQGDGALDCTLGTMETCEAEIAPRAAAPHHLLLFVEAVVDADEDPILASWGLRGPVEPGLWLVSLADEANPQVLPLGAEPIVFEGLMGPNLF